MSNSLPYSSNTPIHPTGFASPPPSNQAFQYQPGAIGSPPPPPPPPKSGPAPSDQGNARSVQGGPPPRPGPPVRSNTQGSFSGTPVASPSQQQQKQQFQHQHQQPFVSQSPGGPVPPTPGEQWLPDLLRDKSKADLERILNEPALLTALLHAPATRHPSLPASQAPLAEQLAANVALARAVLGLEGQMAGLRASLGPQLVRVAALERQFRAKQEAMDDALAPWAPKAVRGRLGQGVLEQEAWCQAMEESFLDGSGRGGGGGGGGDGDNGGEERTGSGLATDRELGEWLRKYKEGRKVLELRKEKKLRLEEGRVGGWK